MAQGKLHVLAYLIILTVSPTVVHPEGLSCAMYENTSFTVGFPMATFGDIKEPGRVRCNRSNCCVGVWTFYNGQLQPFVLGCFPAHAECRSEICVPECKNAMYRCLCSSNMCNANVTFSHKSPAPEPKRRAHWNDSCDWTTPVWEQPRNASNSSDHVAIHAAMIIILVALCASGIIIVKWGVNAFLARKEDELELQEMPTLQESGPPTMPVEGLILLQALREDLWLGALSERGVIIKCFPPPMKDLYSQEWRILNLLTPLQHENIVCLLTAGTGSTGVLEHHQLLVLQHYPEGSLRSYLTVRTTDWATACRMAFSLSRGLAFLHANIRKEHICKPAIAHRDLSSENILVTADSSCVISDFGLSVVLEDYQMKKNGNDPAVLNMTGTLRYMSPEMLDGSLNLMSWELALTQADVYSLGLLLWEIFSRCNDLYADHQSPEFRVVFSEELGPNPSLDELLSLVAENKRRPQLPKNWRRKKLQLYKTLWETLEDCWDPDSEARLTAQCAEQRLHNLATHSLPSENSLSHR
ncbi:anti-Muellerian hormone type-2 receptor isoform X2 [Rana temporaria]|uniref:anti-Muellerian hormone type-2 receptor isoform X2 n=1 Tax=Rana temporaria TaxID=8407 RepID=UPI001AADDB05|nr:anti-Muellerian hormone type-2 receptor isoform X2 [Rana temporaria]